jgi:predicted AAA+ superfamily ATPase
MINRLIKTNVRVSLFLHPAVASLGSASGDTLCQSAESLAGRVGHLEPTPLLAAELRPGFGQLQSLWLRGGSPSSYLAPTRRLRSHGGKISC